MNITITGHHITVTDMLEAYVRDKIAKPMRHFDKTQSIHVKLIHDKQRSNACHAEAILRVSGQEMFVKADSDDLHQAINKMADMLTRQVRKHKTRLEKRYGGHQKFEAVDVFAKDVSGNYEDYLEYDELHMKVS